MKGAIFCCQNFHFVVCISSSIVAATRVCRLYSRYDFLTTICVRHAVTFPVEGTTSCCQQEVAPVTGNVITDPTRKAMCKLRRVGKRQTRINRDERCRRGNKQTDKQEYWLRKAAPFILDVTDRHTPWWRVDQGTRTTPRRTPWRTIFGGMNTANVT